MSVQGYHGAYRRARCWWRRRGRGTCGGWTWCYWGQLCASSFAEGGCCWRREDGWQVREGRSGYAAGYKRMCLPFLTTTDDIDCVQVSELAEEQELRDLFERFGRVTRVFLARDRETQRAKGFAFISFADRDDAARACEKMDGCRFSHVTVNMAAANWNSRLSPLDSPRGIRQAYLECLLLFGLTTIGRKNGQGETASLRVYALLIMIDPVSMLPVRMIKALFCHNEYSLFQMAPGHRATLRWQSQTFRGFLVS